MTATPEEQELERLLFEQASLQDAVAGAELELETLTADLHRFRHHYNGAVGVLYVEIDRLDAEIANARAGRSPESQEAKIAAEKAEKKAEETARAAGVSQQEPPPPSPPSAELKKAYRQAAKAMHPDMATDEIEKERRHAYMVRLNLAYRTGNLADIDRVTLEFNNDPEVFAGHTIGEKIIKAIRTIAQLRRRLDELDKAQAAARDDPMYVLAQKCTEALTMGHDILAELTTELMKVISEKKITLDHISTIAAE